MRNEELIIKEVRKERGSCKKLLRYYECRCINENCTNLTYRDAYSMGNWSGNCKPCADIPKLAKARTVPNPADGKPYEALYNNLCKHAKQKGKSNSLTFDEFVTFTKYEECHYCKSEIKWTVRNLAKNGSRYNLDRKDNTLGYSKENCVPCCWTCNNGRGNLFSYEDWHGMTGYLRNKK